MRYRGEDKKDGEKDGKRWEKPRRKGGERGTWKFFIL